jgi:hypothetical protein
MFDGMVELATDHMEIFPFVERMSDGSVSASSGGTFRSILGKLFGLMLKPQTTREQAEAWRSFSKSIATRCSWPRSITKAERSGAACPDTDV